MSHESVRDRTTVGLRTSLDPLLEHIAAAFELAGLAVGVVQEGLVVYARGLGVRSVATQEPVTANSLFHMASISKLFVTTAVMQLYEHGQVDLAAPVVQYLPYFELADERYRTITVAQMLSHTSGMPDVEDYEWGRPEHDAGALERYVRGLRQHRLIANPGEKFAYSNMAFEVLGDLIAKVSGEPFEDYVQQNILGPLGMRESTFLKERVAPDLATSPHLRAPVLVASDIYPYHRAHGPSSTLHSSAVEMCLWGLVHLSRGTLGGRQILAPSSYDLLWQPRALTGWDDDPHQAEIGLGWFLGQHRGVRAVCHSGGDVGYNTSFVMLPEKGVAVTVLANLCPAPVETVASLVLDTVLGDQPSLPKPPVLVPLGHTLASVGLAGAIAHYRRAGGALQEAYDLGADQLREAAECLLEPELQRYTAAIDVLRLAQEIHPDAWWTFRLLGEAYMKEGDREQARQNLQQALRMKPDSEEAAALLQKLDGGL